MTAVLGFITKKPVIAGLAALAIASILYLGYRHYTGLLNEVKVLQATASTLELGLDTERAAVQDLKGIVGEWEQAQADLEAQIQEMQDEAHQAREEARRLRDLFADLDFSDMSSADVDSVATDVVDRLWGLFETATGDQRGHGAGGTTPGEGEAADAGAGGADAAGLDRGGDGGREGDRPDPAPVREPVP